MQVPQKGLLMATAEKLELTEGSLRGGGKVLEISKKGLTTIEKPKEEGKPDDGFELILSAIGVNYREQADKTISVNLVGALASNLKSGEKINISASGAGGDYQNERISYKIIFALPDGDTVAETRAKELLRQTNAALGAFSENLHFTAHPKITQKPFKFSHSRKIEPIGLAADFVQARKMGFLRGHDKAGEAAILFSLPAANEQALLTECFNAIIRAPYRLEAVLTLEKFSLTLKDQDLLRTTADGVEEGSIFLRPANSLEDVLPSKDSAEPVSAWLKHWARAESGFRITCSINSDEGVPDGISDLLGGYLFAGKIAQDGTEAKYQPKLDLRNAIPAGVSIPDFIPGPDLLAKAGVPIRYPAPRQLLPKQGVILGKVTDFVGDREVRLSEIDRSKHLYVMGATGTGKSTMLLNMIRQDMDDGKGICLLDPHGDLFSAALNLVPKSRVEDVVCLDVTDTEWPIGLNLLDIGEDRKPAKVNFVVNEMIRIFDRLYDLRQTGGPIFEKYMRAGMLLLLSNPDDKPNLVSVERLFEDEEFRRKAKLECKDKFVLSAWQNVIEHSGGEASFSNIAPYITSKLNQFVLNPMIRPIIGQKEIQLDLRKVMDERKILLVNLPKGVIGEMDARLLGMVLVGQLFSTAMGRVSISREERVPFSIYIDEFQNFTTDTVAAILAEGRKFGINLTMANQSLSQLVMYGHDNSLLESVLGNAGSLVVFRVGPHDSEKIGTYMGCKEEPEKLEKLPDYHASVRLLANGKPLPNFVMKTMEQPKTRLSALNRKKIIANSRMKYGQPREAVELALLKALGHTDEEGGLG